MNDITSEDRSLIKSHIILPRVLSAFERDAALVKTHDVVDYVSTSFSPSNPRINTASSPSGYVPLTEA